MAVAPFEAWAVSLGDCYDQRQWLPSPTGASAFASMSMTFAQRESMSVKLPRTLRCEVSRFLAATIYALVALSGLSMSTAAEDGPAPRCEDAASRGGEGSSGDSSRKQVPRRASGRGDV